MPKPRSTPEELRELHDLTARWAQIVSKRALGDDARTRWRLRTDHSRYRPKFPQGQTQRNRTYAGTGGAIPSPSPTPNAKRAKGCRPAHRTAKTRPA
jgi:hypothetical protein